ncbi:AAA family ATPase [Sulfobacillus thermosulfidooxidans]|uniref:AAA family ATPase n=1 Tax=Sulfobacillus thermosulfidooxidans TaxID=28034 RepID=UPI0006B63E8F|nr:ParA family protein [Sulfobacillus thermosulfidooxidans]
MAPSVKSDSPVSEESAVAVLAWALGAVSQPFRIQVAESLPLALRTERPWSIADLGDTTDSLWHAAEQIPPGDCPWTTLLVTSELTGTIPLADVLVRIKTRFPALRIALLVAHLTDPMRQVITTLAAYHIYNVLVGTEFTLELIAGLVTRDASWEAIQPYLGTAVEPVANLAMSAAPSPDQAPRSETVPSYTVAVVSGKGGVGKTGIIANLLAVKGSWNTIALDLDYIKPSLPLYFHEANDTPALDLRRLLTQIQTHHRPSSPSSGAKGLALIEALTDDDLRDIQQYVTQAEVVTANARIVPGASRFETVMPVPPPVVMSAILTACQKQARFVFVDTPGVPTDPVWIHSVRQADFVVIVTTPEYAVLLETIDLMRKLDLLGIPREKRGLIINKRSKWGYSTASIRTTHLPGLPLLGEIPYDPARWERALQNHHPLALDHPKPWQALFTAITHVESPRARRDGWFRWSRR